MIHNLPRLSLFADGRVGKMDGQQEAQKKLIAMLAERGFEIPEDPTEIKKNHAKPNPAKPARLCQELPQAVGGQTPSRLVQRSNISS